MTYNINYALQQHVSTHKSHHHLESKHVAVKHN